MRLLVCLSALVGMVFLVGCGDPLANTDLERAECTFDPFFEISSQAVNCYTLDVPMTRSDPRSPVISLGVYLVKARRPSDEPPIIFLIGGPGEYAEFTLLALKDHPVRERRNIIVLEQRGTGISNWFCPQWPFDIFTRVSALESYEAQNQMYEGMLVDCVNAARELGHHIESYNTEESAHDVAALRAALGAETIDLWGVSYGTVLGQAYMALEPERVGTTVFDGFFAIDEPWIRTTVPSFMSSIERLETFCEREADCTFSEGGLANRILSVVAEYEDRPMRLEIAAGEFDMPYDVTHYIHAEDAMGLIFQTFYYDNAHIWVGDVLDDLEHRSRDDLALTLLGRVTPFFSTGMHYSVACQGAAYSQEDVDLLFREYPEWADWLQVDRGPIECALLGLEPQEYTAPVFHSGPMLIMSGWWDPISPLSLAEAVQYRFPAADLVEVPYASHGSSMWLPCAQEMVGRYFEGEPPEIRSECRQTREDY